MPLISAPFWLNVSNLGCSLLYALAAILIWHQTRVDHKKQSVLVLLVVLLGFSLHSLDLSSRLFQDQALNLSLGNSISLVAWMAVLLYLLAALFRPIVNLGIAILPTTLLAVLISGWLRSPENPIQNQAASTDIHLALAVVAFGILSLAFAQAFLIVLQDQQLRRHLTQPTHKAGFFFPSLPPLQTMETILFQLLIIGFMLLTSNLVTGLASNQHDHGQLFRWNHHILLTLIAWLGYGLLITGHYLKGWRGQQAARYTMIGFGVFILGYFGPRIVRELILATPL